jgi:hypothetical protein
MRITDRARSEHINSNGANPGAKLLEDARRAAKASACADFKPDPLFSPEFSRLISASTSAAKRHGPLIEKAIAGELERAPMTVLRNVAVPITEGGLAMSESRDYSTLVNKQIDFDDKRIADVVDIDILAIDESNGWAGAFSVKRGGGLTEPRKRKANERELRALNFTLASWLRHKGYRTVETATAAVIDYLGQSGFSKDLTIDRDAIDEFFGLPIVAGIDAMTAAMSEALNSELRNLLVPIMRKMSEDETPHDMMGVMEGTAPTLLRARRRINTAGSDTASALATCNVARRQNKADSLGQQTALSGS